MAPGAIYQSASFATWDDSPDYAHNERSLGFVPYQAPPPRGQPSQQQQSFQVWRPPSSSSFDTYADTPQMQPSELPRRPSPPSSPPTLLRRSLIDDPAFAMDPHANVNNWMRGGDAVAQYAFPVAASGVSRSEAAQTPIPVTASHRSRRNTYHSDNGRASPLPESVFFVPPSTAASSSSGSMSSSTHSTSSVPRSSGRTSDHADDRHREPVYYVPATETSVATSDARAPRPRPASHQPPRAPPSYDDSVEDLSQNSGSSSNHQYPPDQKAAPVVISYNPPQPPESQQSNASQSGSSERPKERRRTSSRPPPADLDSIDELDETNPYGVGIHHKGPYEAIAAILTPGDITSPSLVARRRLGPGDPKNGEPREPRHSRRAKPPPSNPLSLNLQPGQILQNSIFQPPPQAPPLERAPATFPREHHHHRHRPPQADLYPPPTVSYDPMGAGSSPLRRNQTLPVPGPSYAPPERSYRVPPPTPQDYPAPSGSYGPYTSDPRIYQPPPPNQRPAQDAQYDVQPPQAPSRRASQFYDTARQPQYQNDAVYQPAPPPLEPPRPPQNAQLPPMSRPNSFYEGIPPPPTLPPAQYPGPPSGDPQSQGRQRRQSRVDGYPFPESITPLPSQSGPYQTPPPEPPRQQSDPRPPPPSRPHSFYEAPNPPPQPRPTPSPRPVPPPGPSPPDNTSRQRHTPPQLPTPPQDSRPPPQPRRYEPPSQTVANQQNRPRPDIRMPPPSITSSSNQSSSLAPSYLPKRLVMPTPLATSPENMPPDPQQRRARFADEAGPRRDFPPPQQQQHRRQASTIPMHQEGSKNLLRKRSAPAAVPQREPEQHSGGVLAFFGFGKSGKTRMDVREVRVTEPKVVNGVQREMRQVRSEREEISSKKLSKRK